MKKIFLSLIAMLVSVASFAQYQNLYTGDYVSKVTEPAANWYTNIADNAWIILDLGEAKKFNTIDLVMRDAKCSTANVLVTNDYSAYYDGETFTAPATYTKSFTDLYTTNEGTANPETKVLVLDEAANGRYVVIVLDGSFNGWYTLAAQSLAVYDTTVKNVFAESKTDLGKVVLGGFLNAENKSSLETLDATVVDLRSVTIEGTLGELKTANPNTIFLLDEITGVADVETYGITNSTNVVRMDGAAWYNALTPIVFDDAYSFFSTGDGINHINTNSQGYTFSRKIAAGKYATVALPGFDTLPASLQAFEITAYNAGEVTFTEVDAVEANKPYVVYAKSDATITITGGGDFMWQTDAATTKGDVTFTKANQDIIGDGTQYGIKTSIDGNLTLGKVVAPGKIKAGRAYFTLGAGAKDVKLNFVSNETTGISNVEAAKTADEAIYTLGGVRVKNATKGVYIIGGKKVIK